MQPEDLSRNFLNDFMSTKMTPRIQQKLMRTYLRVTEKNHSYNMFYVSSIFVLPSAKPLMA